MCVFNKITLMFRLCGRCILGNTYWSLVTRICICPLFYFLCLCVCVCVCVCVCGATAHLGPTSPHCWSSEVTHRFGRSSLNEGSARRRDSYLTTQHQQETDIHAPGGIRTRSLTKRLAADRAATRIGSCIAYGYLLVQLGMRIRVGLSAWHSCRWDVPRYCAPSYF